MLLGIVEKLMRHTGYLTSRISGKESADAETERRIAQLECPIAKKATK